MVSHHTVAIRARDTWGELRHQITIARRSLLIAAAVAAVCIGAVVAIATLRGVQIDYLTRDIYLLSGKPIYYGLLSMLGIMAWSAGAAIWAFGWALLRRAEPGSRLGVLCLASALFSLILLGDDAFMLHEHVLPDKLGIPEPLVMFTYVIAGVAYVIMGWRTIAATPYLPALCAGLFLGASLLLDQMLPSSPARTMVEDGLKFTGIAFWLAYASATTAAALRACIEQGQAASQRPRSQERRRDR